MTAEAAAVARRAAEIIQERGIHKGGVFDFATGRVCLLGAISAAVREQLGRSDAALASCALRAAAAAIVRVHGETIGFGQWNDLPDTDEQDVAKVLLQAADRLDVQ